MKFFSAMPLAALSTAVVLVQGCTPKNIIETDLPGKYVAVGVVNSGANGVDYFILKPDGTFQRYLRGSGETSISVSAGKWRVDLSHATAKLTLDGFRLAPWQVPRSLPSNVSSMLGSSAGVSIGEVDRYHGKLRVRFISDVNYWFEKN